MGRYDDGENRVAYSGEIGSKTGMAIGGLGTGSLTIDRAGRFQQFRVQNNWDFGRDAFSDGSFFSVSAESAGANSGFKGTGYAVQTISMERLSNHGTGAD